MSLHDACRCTPGVAVRILQDSGSPTRNADDQPLLFEPTFNRAVKVRAGDDRITSDAGLLLLREADHRLGVTELLANKLYDPRQPNAIRYQLVELLRERVFALAHGYAAQDDADRLAHDPAMKLAAWDQSGEQTLDERLASQPTQSRLIDLLTMTASNRASLRDSLGDACERHLRAASAGGICGRPAATMRPGA